MYAMKLYEEMTFQLSLLQRQRHIGRLIPIGRVFTILRILNAVVTVFALYVHLCYTGNTICLQTTFGSDKKCQQISNKLIFLVFGKFFLFISTIIIMITYKYYACNE